MLTLNHPNTDYEVYVHEWDVTGLIRGYRHQLECGGEENRLHLQIYIEFSRVMSKKEVIDHFKGCHVEQCRDPAEALKYCRKEDETVVHCWSYERMWTELPLAVNWNVVKKELIAETPERDALAVRFRDAGADDRRLAADGDDAFKAAQVACHVATADTDDPLVVAEAPSDNLTKLWEGAATMITLEFGVFGAGSGGGSRSDLVAYTKKLVALPPSKLAYAGFMVDNAATYIKCSRASDRLHEAVTILAHGKTRIDRGFHPRVIIHYGAPGTGKTRKALEADNGLTDGKRRVFLYRRLGNPDRPYWDAYDSEPVVVLDDFHGYLRVTDLLALADRYEVRLDQRGTYTHSAIEELHITCNVWWQDWYKLDIWPSKLMEAFRRRITTLYWYRKGHERVELSRDSPDPEAGPALTFHSVPIAGAGTSGHDVMSLDD